MNQQDKFNNSVAVLVKAYFEGVLEKGNCYACAVGNLVVDAMGFTLAPHRLAWFDSEGQDIPFAWRRNDKEGERQRNAIGYSRAQVILIEQAFEGWGDYNDGPGSEYDGLMRVVDVLAEIHSIDLTTVAASKALLYAPKSYGTL
ncbi:hypothetical protein MUN82_08960 [Hymenobacter aerilatus]|uniref:Uncharacterized protein n=1 Tax=Hymenobacter aerilatus TaxID=2932251 RepID=A0A8T9T2M1_9BACT|nr:hypothetical protein [Hymenobacter aerilatus]UOR07213.1 hypothetical protein MUN82_08960 [Hymenobacter aerilatus]